MPRSAPMLPLLAAALLSLPLHAQPPAPAATPAPTVEPGYKPEKGPFEVAVIDKLTLNDIDRSKDLEVTVRYPKPAAEGESKTFPLVIFSHGAGGSRGVFPDLTTHWASHGYIVIAPTHSDSISLRRANGEDLSDIRNDPTNLRRSVEPMDRVADIKFIIDALDKVEEASPDLHFTDDKAARRGRIDREKIAVAGHSAGALTTQMVVGAKVRGSRSMERGRPAGGGDLLTLKSVADERVKCGIIISGQGTTNRMFTNDSWNALTVPTLTLAGSNDTSPISNETPESRCHPFDYSRGQEKGGPPAYLLWIKGATHSSYSGRAANQTTRRLLNDKSADPPDLDLPMTVRATTAATQAFLDAYLKNDEAAKAFLTDPARMKSLTAEKAELKAK